MTKVYFIRHAEPNYNNRDDMTRELSAKGMVDRELVTQFLSEKNIEIVLSSPYKRAVDTVAHLADSKGLKRSQIFKQAELSENYGYQIFSGIRVPERNKVIMLAFGMGLNLDETQKLLKCADYQTLYVKLPFDSIIVYGLCKGLSVIEVNELLFEYGLSTLS